MIRSTVDRVVSAAGLALAVLLLVATGLLVWAGSFVTGEVHDQLAAQKITFPAAGSEGLSDPLIKPYLTKYAGQQLTTGDQAKAFADHYIAVHLNKIGGGKTYSELSAQAMANPTDTALAGTVQTVFRGETLRGMLLNAYAFGTMGKIAFIAAWASGIGALLFAVLAALGFRHAAVVAESPAPTTVAEA